jgi:hypothetical protein
LNDKMVPPDLFSLEEMLLAIAIHETAHFLADFFLLIDGTPFFVGDLMRPTKRKTIRAGRKAAAKIAAVAEPDDVVESIRRLRQHEEDHGDRFYRAVGHLGHRLFRDCGIDMPWQAILPGHSMKADLWCVMKMLGDELEAGRAEFVTAILERPAPARFTNLFLEHTCYVEQVCSDILEESAHMATATLNTIISGILGRRAEKAKNYQALCLKIANGKSEAPERVEELLLTAGKTLQEFEADVGRVLAKRRLRAVIDRGGEVAEQELAKVNGQLDAADAELMAALRAAEERHDERTAPLIARRKELEKFMREAEQARGELLGMAGPEESQFLRMAGQERGAIENELFKLRDTIKDVHYKWAYAERMKKENPRKDEHFFGGKDGIGVASPIAESAAEAEPLAAQLEELRSRECKLTAELAKKTQAEADARRALVAT